MPRRPSTPSPDFWSRPPDCWRSVPSGLHIHSASEAALIGGGRDPRSGEVSLAHNGVLFLDEIVEFERRTLEALREPLEDGTVRIARALRTVQFPARFLLVGAK